MQNQNFTFGMPSLPRQKQPCMFQILSWAGKSQMTCSRYEEIDTRKQQCCQKTKAQVETHKQYADKIIQKSQQKKCKNQENCEQIYKDHHHQPLKNSTVYPKQIKHQLYSFQKATLRRSSPQAIKQQGQCQGKKISKKLQKDNEQNLDPKTIQERKRRIKEWELVTRNLPNSAFTTYYGKPAFEAYGRGSSSKNLRSHNVMPHKGENNPKDVQTHYAALLKGRQIKAISHIPRNPIQQFKRPLQEKNTQLNIHLPLQKPDLIKNKRFSTQRPVVQKKKQRIPTQSVQSNPKITKAIRPKDNLTISRTSQKGKNNKNKTFMNANDGLKYMNKRDNLISLLEDKKTRASQLAYKVTECCPVQWSCSNVCESKIVQWKDLSAAGKKQQQGDHVKDIIIQAHI